MPTRVDDAKPIKEKKSVKMIWFRSKLIAFLTCSQRMRKSGRCSSNVSPNNGLNGLPRRSQFEANADTANPEKNREFDLGF